MRTVIYFIGLIIVLNLPVNLIAQYSTNYLPTDNPQIDNCIEKYWHYRDRLKYFVTPGSLFNGESMVAGIRNLIGKHDSTKMSFGQESVYLGYYMSVLATEYKLLSDNNADGANNAKMNQDLKELCYALHAYIYQMDFNEQQCYNKPYCDFDGFFVRSQIPDYFVNPNCMEGLINYQNLNNFGELTYENSAWDPNNYYFGNSSNPLPYGKPGYINAVTPTVSEGFEPMSQDEAIGLLMGLTLIVKYIPDGNFQITGLDNHNLFEFLFSQDPNYCNIRHIAQEIIYRIVRYIGSGGFYTEGDAERGWCTEEYVPTPWQIYKPNCEPVGYKNGGDVLAFAYPLTVMAHTWSYPENYSYGVEPPGWNAYTVSALLGLQNAGNDWMGCTVAALSNVNDASVPPNDFLKVVSSYYNWDPFYVLLRADLFDQLEPEELPNAFNLMVNAPCEGPYKYSDAIKGNDGWCTSYRWHFDITEQLNGRPNDFNGNYNGLDYMLLLNLSLIQLSNNVCNLTGNVPFYDASLPGFMGDDNNIYQFSCVNTIESNQVFQNYSNSINHQSANGTYTSRTAIILKPGFKVENGARFHAIVWGSNPYLDYQEGITCDYSNTTKSLNIDIVDEKSNNDTVSYSVFPNPTSGNIEVSYKESKVNASISIYDAFGRIIYLCTTQTFPLQINLTGNKPGLYFVKITTNENSYTKKIIIE
jgi:hypothetical protein